MKERLKEFKNRIAGGTLPKLIYLLIRLLYATMRIRVVGGEIPKAYHDRGEGTINVFWHARLLMLPFAYIGVKSPYILISSHGDGEIIANVMKCFGFSLVRGSSSKRGTKALKEMVKLAREHHDLGITPDGPRGPAEVVKPGVPLLGRLTGRPVIPLAYSCSRAKRFDSWDRFMLPYPFSRGVIVWGEALNIRAEEDDEAFRIRIEQALREVTAKADGYFRK
jgi:lysophospholipid acyltransferase (LPLAT)-like uncharacterized protein